MPATLLFGFIMMILSAYMWKLELAPFISGLKTPELSKYTVIKIFQRIKYGISNAFRMFTDGKWFLLDILITVISISFLGFGQGVLGGIMGLAFSNVVSVLILITMRDRRKINAAKV